MPRIYELCICHFTFWWVLAPQLQYATNNRKTEHRCWVLGVSKGRMFHGSARKPMSPRFNIRDFWLADGSIPESRLAINTRSRSPNCIQWYKLLYDSQKAVCVVQCNAVQCSAVQCSAVQCSAVQCSAVQAVQCSAVQCSAVQCSAVQCSAVQCSAVQCSGCWPKGSMHYALHYITLRHFIRQLHLQWPMVRQQSHSSSPNASLKRWVFKSFLKVSVFVSSWRLDGREFHAFGPGETRNSAHRTLVSTVEVHIGGCWRISVSHDLAGQRRVSSCPIGTQGCDQLAPGAWAHRACKLCGTWSEASVNSGGLEWCGPAFLFLQRALMKYSRKRKLSDNYSCTNYYKSKFKIYRQVRTRAINYFRENKSRSSWLLAFPVDAHSDWSKINNSNDCGDLSPLDQYLLNRYSTVPSVTPQWYWTRIAPSIGSFWTKIKTHLFSNLLGIKRQLYFIVLCCAVASHRIASHRTAPHRRELHRTAPHCTAPPHRTAPHRTALHCTALHCTVLYCTVLYRIVSYRIVSHRIVSYRILTYRIVSYRIVSFRIVSYRIVSFRIVSYRIVTYLNVSYRKIQYTLVGLGSSVGWAPAGLTYVFAKGVSDQVRDPLTPRNSLQ